MHCRVVFGQSPRQLPRIKPAHCPFRAPLQPPSPACRLAYAPTSFGVTCETPRPDARTILRMPLPAPAQRRSLALALSVVLLAGCAQQPARPILQESPTPLVAGTTLVSPIDRAGAAWTDTKTGEPPPILLSDGQIIPTSVTALYPHPPRNPDSTWLPNPGTWQRTSTINERSITMLVASLPQSAMGQAVWMTGRRLPSFWLLPNLDGTPHPRATPTIAPPTLSRDHAIALVRSELANPTLRWRAELAITRLGIEPPLANWADPLLEAWATQSQARWHAAEQRLRAADQAVADRLIDGLTRWLVTADTVLPIWPTRADDVNDLILAILRPGASDEAIRRTVLAYLERQPQWLAWVANDAGDIVGGSIAAVNLSPTPALLSVRAPTGPWEAHGMLAPGELALVPTPSTTMPSATPVVWEVRLGGRTRALPVTTNAIPLTPPGMPIGPFWHDWTLDGLIAGTGQSPSPGQTGWIGGLIQKDTRLDSRDATSSGWVVYIEVRRPPCDLPRAGQPTPDIDAVRLSFGPTNTPRAEVTVRCTGHTTFDIAAPSQGAILNTTTNRWAFTLPIDSAWLESDGTFLIGVQSLPHDGRRATWPRPLLPGQQTIGRVRIDPSAWHLQSAIDRQTDAITAR